MVLINADHRGAAVLTAAVTAGLTGAYVAYVRASPYGPSGGSWPGLAFGIAGTAAMLVAGLLAARRKVRTWRIGSALVWMQLHIWLGVLAVPLILFHGGFRLGGPLTTVLMVTFAVVTGTGLLGLALQQLLPAMMTARVPLETVATQIAHVRAGLAVDAYELVASIAGPIPEAAEEQAWMAAEAEATRLRPGNWRQVSRQPAATGPVAEAAQLRAFYLAEIRPFLGAGRRRPVHPPDFGPPAAAAPEWRSLLERLAGICEEARQLTLQERFQWWLHGWVLVHAPLSFLLLVLTGVHVFFALRY